MSNAFHKDEIIRLDKDGFSYKQIAKTLNCSLGTISYHLGEGQKEKTRKRSKYSKAVKKERINRLYKSAPCMDCGVTYHPCQMDFDHREGVDKVAGVNQIIKNGNWEDALAEIAKCDLVCSNCHRLRTQNRINARKGL